MKNKIEAAVIGAGVWGTTMAGLMAEKEYDVRAWEFNKETADGRKMNHYSDLLQTAVATIVQQKEESDLESLFSFGETTALVGDIAGLDDFELICFLVIKEEEANG